MFQPPSDAPTTRPFERREVLRAAVDLAEPSSGARDEAFWKGGASRAKPFPSPADILPPGTAPLVEAGQVFTLERGMSLALLESADWDSRRRLVDHPVGKIDAYECLILMSQHPARHALQIAEIKRHPDYPKA